MLTYATIAAGKPSEMAPMSRHMLTQTIPKEVADLARYYTRGMEVKADEAMPRRDMHPLAARGLGIDPDRPVSLEQINALLAGRRADGEKITGKRYVPAREWTDEKTGEKKESIPIGSVDFCLTPDKSVSVAWAFGTPAEQAAIYQAHRDAAQDAMRYVERHIAWARKGDGGKGGADPGHVGWISFDHFTSRPTLWIARDENGKQVTEAVPVQVAGDPDLHTHFTVMNAVFCENGRVGSLDLDRLDGFIKEAGALYQAHLATNLRGLGANVVLDQDTGSARLSAIPEHVRDHFSKKTLNGEEAARSFAAAQGLDWDELSPERRAGLLKAGVQGLPTGLDDETRAKLRKDDMADFAEWRRQTDELDWKHETVFTHDLNRSKSTGLDFGVSQNLASNDAEKWDRPSTRQRLDRAYVEALPWFEKEINRRAVVSEHEARTAAARGLIVSGIDDHRDIDRVMDAFRERGVRQYGEMTTLIFGQEAGKKARSVTTGLHERHEREFIKKARTAAADRSAELRPEQIDVAVAASGLDFTSDHGQAQLAAIHRLGEGGKLGVLVGAAGAGKSALLQPLVSAWRDQGDEVHGIALAWRQADDLIDAGIDKANIRAISVFLSAVDQGTVTLSEQSVVVVDELSLLGTRQGLELLRLQADYGFRLVMIGDERQAQAIEAGPVIDLFRKALGDEAIPEILTTIRQQTERERDIAGLFREGKAALALGMKREDGTAELVAGGYRETAERVAALVRERLEANAHDPAFSLTVSAPTNMDAHRLGMAIRETRRAMGQVGPDLVTVPAADRDGTPYDLALARGDKVRLFASTRADGERGSIGRNGSILTVRDASRRGVRLATAKGREGFVSWKTLAKDGRVRLAYGEVQTTHTAQGSTASEHIYAMPAGTKAVTGFSAYSSGTRHRQRSFMVISDGAERAEVKARRPLNDTRIIGEDDVWANAARNLSRQPVKATALDFLDKASGIERGAARAMQRGLQRMELRQRRGQVRSTLHTLFQRGREAAAARLVAERLDQAAEALEPVSARLAGLGERIGAAVERGVAEVRRLALDERGGGPVPRWPKTTGNAGAKRWDRLRKVVPRIPKHHIDDLKRSVSLTHLIGQTVPLDRHGKALCPFHEERTPSLHVNERKGTFTCYGCGAHGDAVDWLQQGRGLSFKDAVSYLEGRTGIELPPPVIVPQIAKEPIWVPVFPVPDGVPSLFKGGGWTAEVFNPKAAELGRDRVSKAYRPAHVAEYRDSAGQLAGYVLRVEHADGGKFTPQVTWAVPVAEKDADPLAAGRWCLISMDGPRPLYHAEALARHPDRPVLVVMGEKKADALQKVLGDGAVVVSWAGGDNGRSLADWSVLKGRDVTIWPDADRSGKAAAVGEKDRDGRPKPGVCHYVEMAGVASVKVMVPPSRAPKGWDAGDMIAAGADRQQIETFMAERAVEPQRAARAFERQELEAETKEPQALEREQSVGMGL